MDTSLLISVIGLMATFAQERRGQSDSETQATIEDYKEWLRRGQHDTLIGMLDSNQELLVATDRFLRSGQEEILERLGLLEESLAQSLISTAGWAEITLSLNPKAWLSQQAVDILRWFDATGGSNAVRSNTRGGVSLVPNGSGADEYKPVEESARFFDADLETLVGHGLLIEGVGSEGSTIYTITREAIHLVCNLDETAGV
jgi:hypothetical protein